MIKINKYTAAGTKGSVTFPKALEEDINMDLLAQAVRVYQDRSHPGLSKVKSRSEVDLTTAKVWRQKGTGRARHGARSAPIFVGGGVAHGPKGVKRTLKMSRKMAQKSLLIALSQKAKKSHIVIASEILKIKKTKDAQKFINVVISKEKLKIDARVSLIISKEDVQTRMVFRNIKNVKVLNYRNLSILDVYLGGLLIFEKSALEAFTKAKTSVGKKTNKKKEITGSVKKTEGTKKSNTERRIKKTEKKSVTRGVRKTRAKKSAASDKSTASQGGKRK